MYRIYNIYIFAHKYNIYRRLKMDTGEFGAMLSSDEASMLFDDTSDIDVSHKGKAETLSKDEETDNKEEKQEKDDTTEVTVEDLFGDTEPESVGSENDKDKEDTKSAKNSSPNTYSSIAKAFADDGIFPNLTEEEINNIKTPEDFRAALDKQREAEMNEDLLRIKQALGYGVEPSVINKYEQTLSWLNNINTNSLSQEGEEGDNIRKQLIYQDYINRGYSKDKAVKMVERSFNVGTDIEDATDALESVKDYFGKQYGELINEAKSSKQEADKQRKQDEENLKKSLLDDKKVFGDIDIDTKTRQKAFDCISKAYWKDPNTGEYYTELQKYEKDNHNEFMKNVGLLYALTDGFKNVDKLVNQKAKKEINKGIRSLEATLNNTARNYDGSLKFISSVGDDPESFNLKGIKLDI